MSRSMKEPSANQTDELDEPIGTLAMPRPTMIDFAHSLLLLVSKSARS
jgi:hypothetical protein